MKLYTLGTSAGTQPKPGFRHTSLAIETQQGVYFLDAGESGAYTAHLCGLDLLKTRAVFISHPHMDHVGGLGNLLWYVRKVSLVRKTPQYSGNIDIFTPCRATVDGTMMVLQNTEGDFLCEHTHTVHDVQDGLLFDNGDIRVSAVHTNHMPQRNGKYMSYAFHVEHEGKKLVFTGDTRLEDLQHIVPDTCDALLVETGHHQIEDICAELKKQNKQVGRLFFVHHGGYIQVDPEAALQRAQNAFGDNVEITRDGNIYTI